MSAWRKETFPLLVKSDLGVLSHSAYRMQNVIKFVEAKARSKIKKEMKQTEAMR